MECCALITHGEYFNILNRLLSTLFDSSRALHRQQKGQSRTVSTVYRLLVTGYTRTAHCPRAAKGRLAAL